MSIAQLFESGARKQQRGHLQNIVLLAMADGDISDKELVFIHKIGRSLGLTHTQIGNILDEPRAAQVMPPVTKEDRMERMVEMVMMVQMDGVIAPDELNMLSRFAIQIGYSTIEEVNINLILRNTREGKPMDEIVTEMLK